MCFWIPRFPGLRYGMLDWDSTGVLAVRLHGSGGCGSHIPNRPEWGGTILRKAAFDLESFG